MNAKIKHAVNTPFPKLIVEAHLQHVTAMKK
jgi:hypothetical protein